MLRIGTLSVDPPLFLAPMAGVTDRDFRLLIRRIGGVGVVALEFLSSKAIAQGEKRLKELMHFVEEERPLAMQIYGSDVDTMAEAAAVVETLQPEICDINMGCPANKILKNCAGAALMGNLKLAEAIIARVRRTVSVPLTVKFRLGLDDKRRNYLELGRICEANGVDAVALHARTARQGFRGEATWDDIARLKAALSIPVLGNGDVRDADDALALMRHTGCDGVMIGRGATRNPWIFRQIADRLAGRPAEEKTLDDRRRLILEHFRTVIERDEERLALHRLRNFTGWYSHGLPDGARLRRQISSLKTPPDFLEAMVRFFEAVPEDDQRDERAA
jgi:tRNA-dihydrouridine synthase B